MTCELWAYIIWSVVPIELIAETIFDATRRCRTINFILRWMRFPSLYLLINIKFDKKVYCSIFLFDVCICTPFRSRTNCPISLYCIPRCIVFHFIIIIIIFVVVVGLSARWTTNTKRNCVHSRCHCDNWLDHNRNIVHHDHDECVMCVYVRMVWRIMQSKANRLIRIESNANPNDRSEKMPGAHSWMSSSACSVGRSVLHCFCLNYQEISKRDCITLNAIPRKIETHASCVRKKKRTKLTTALRVERLNSIQKKQ